MTYTINDAVCELYIVNVVSSDAYNKVTFTNLPDSLYAREFITYTPMTSSTSMVSMDEEETAAETTEATEATTETTTPAGETGGEIPGTEG